MNIAQQMFTEEAIVESNKRAAKLAEYFNSDKLMIDSDIDTYGIMLRSDDNGEPRCTIVLSLNPRIKTPSALIVVKGIYKLVTYNIRHDIWKYWKTPNYPQPLPNIEVMDYINEVLKRRGVADVVAYGSHGSRITTKGVNHFCFGFGSSIAAHVYLGSDYDGDDKLDMFRTFCVRVEYNDCTYFVKVPHALESGHIVDSFRGFAIGLVPLVHAYRTSRDSN